MKRQRNSDADERGITLFRLIVIRKYGIEGLVFRRFKRVMSLDPEIRRAALISITPFELSVPPISQGM